MPDLLAGTSAGAGVAALYAFSLSPEELRVRLGHLNWRLISSFSFEGRGVLANDGGPTLH